MRSAYRAYNAPSPVPSDQPFNIDQDAVTFVSNIKHPNGATRPFAALTYITPCFHESDHPVMEGKRDGPQWLAWVVNAIGESPYWTNTTIIVTWDDWGGWFDHYLGPTQSWPYHPYPNPYLNTDDPNEWGFRVPLIVISPYVTNRGYISSKVRSQGAILNYVEAHFGLPSLGTDDATNSVPNPPGTPIPDALQDMVNEMQQPLPYVPVNTTFTPGPAPSPCGAGG